MTEQQNLMDALTTVRTVTLPPVVLEARYFTTGTRTWSQELNLVVAVITVTQDWNLTLIATDQWHQNVCIIIYVLISKHTSLIPRREAMNTVKPPLQCSSSPMLNNNESFCTEAPVGGVSEKLQNFRYLWTERGYQIGSLISSLSYLQFLIAGIFCHSASDQILEVDKAWDNATKLVPLMRTFSLTVIQLESATFDKDSRNSHIYCVTAQLLLQDWWPSFPGPSYCRTLNNCELRFLLTKIHSLHITCYVMHMQKHNHNTSCLKIPEWQCNCYTTKTIPHGYIMLCSWPTGHGQGARGEWCPTKWSARTETD